MDTSLIDSIDWKNLVHAYGPAIDAPKELANLIGDDEDDRDDAVNGFLYSSAYHQGTVYSCTPSVIRCVIYIIETEDISSLETIGAPLVRELLCFVNICARTWRFVPEIGEAAFVGCNLCKDYLDHADSKTSAYAKELTDFCKVYENS
ncbi:hypothetical protein ACJJI3_03555 [Microbulbifer sp. ZKSA004]|uniref:hypothetical protein n=1 Tax=Microbulbifer sp. ZKSA004 TaxID=3243389 RepID=UPI00403942E9